MLSGILLPPVSRLTADGASVRVSPGGFLGRLRRPVQLLPRELCAFSAFDTRILPRARRRQAAALHMRTASPYLVSASTFVRTGDVFGIWWWDAESTTPDLRDAPRTTPIQIPETLAQPAGQDWRIVKLGHGYEAQLWREGGLIASAWRSDPFDGSSWTAFTRLQRDAPASDTIQPAALTLPVSPEAPAFALLRGGLSQTQVIAVAGGLAALALLAVTAFWFGQGMSLSGGIEDIQQDIAEIQASTPKDQGKRLLDDDRRRLATFEQIEGRTSPLSVAGAAIGILAIHDLTPSALDAQQDVLSLTLPYSAMKKADSLIDEFEQSGYFYDIRPRTDSGNQTLIFEMKVREAAPPLSAVE